VRRAVPLRLPREEGAVMYEYLAKLDRVIDGDTVALRIELGFHVTVTEHVRILRVDCPEIGTPEGKDARDFTAHWFYTFGGYCLVRTTKGQPQSFTRWLGEIVTVPIWGPEVNLSDALIAAGHVKNAGQGV
jgi:micrococcal nuclease